MIKVGITGGIGSGKSTVCRLFFVAGGSGVRLGHRSQAADEHRPGRHRKNPGIARQRRLPGRSPGQAGGRRANFRQLPPAGAAEPDRPSGRRGRFHAMGRTANGSLRHPGSRRAVRKRRRPANGRHGRSDCAGSAAYPAYLPARRNGPKRPCGRGSRPSSAKKNASRGPTT